MIVPQNIVRRYLAKTVIADERWKPPASIVNAVDEGKLDPHVLVFWKEVVEIILKTDQARGKDRKSSEEVYKAAVPYWRNKCADKGFPLPKEFLDGQLGGAGSEGRWAIKTGDQVEEWVKQTLLSQKLVETVESSADDVLAEISYLEKMVQDSSEKVELHLGKLTSEKGPKGLARRQKWLEGAQANMADFSKKLAASKGTLKALKEAAQKKSQAGSYAIEFEKEFQFLMQVAAKDMTQASVVESVKKAIARFEQGLEIPDAESPAHDIGRYEGPSGKTAGVLDFVAGALAKAWSYLVGAFDYFTDWIEGVVGTTKKIDKLLSEAGA